MNLQQLASLPPGVPQMAVDDLGKPFILLRDQDNVRRKTGKDAIYENIQACTKLTNSLKTSFGPKGADKIIVSPDGEVTVTNDGATILKEMQIQHQCAKLLVEMSSSQDDEIGDGTTGVVILAGALLDKAQDMVRNGLHPLKIIEGYERACRVAVGALKEIETAVDIDKDDQSALIQVAKTSLGSKLINTRKEKFARICVDAVLTVADRKRKDVNFDLIRMDCKPGGNLEDSMLVKGVVLDKEFANQQLPKKFQNVSVAVLTCPFEPPKPKTKHKLNISTAADYKRLVEIEQEYFSQPIQHLKRVGADLVICQWGYDYEAQHLLYKAGIQSVRWVGGTEIEHIALSCGAKIVPRFEDLTVEKLGRAQKVTQIEFGTMGETFVIIEQDPAKTATIIIRGGNKVAIKEAERSIHDALCTVRNLVTDPTVIPGGGAAETHCALAVENYVPNVEGVSAVAVSMFAEALMAIPGTLADNSGLNPIECESAIKAAQVTQKNGLLGLDCMWEGEIRDMIELGVWESVTSKRNQITLATQVVKMILRINDVISTAEAI